MEDLTRKWAELGARQKRVRLLYIMHVLIYITALGMAVWRALIPAAVLIGANLLLYFLVVRRQKQAYFHAVNETGITRGLCQPLTDAAYTGRKGLDRRGFEEMEMLPIRDNDSALLVREGFSGKGYGLTLKGWEVSFHYPSSGGGRNAYQFLTGCILTAEGPRTPDPRSDWLVVKHDLVERGAMDAFLKEHGYRISPCSLKALTMAYDVYSRDGEPLPDRWADAFQILSQKVRSLGSLRVTGDMAAAFLAGRFYTGKPKLKILPSAAQLGRNPMPERDPVWDFFRFWSEAGGEGVPTEPESGKR